MKSKFIISGGGTGGHIFPAIAIANRLKKENPEAEILFIGAVGKMEMKRVPEAGYPIVGLPIAGISRSFSLKSIAKNIKLPFLLIKSMRKARKTIREFHPDVVIGVGGFASGPALRSAIELKILTLIQEQNSFPGITNKMLAGKVDRICVAYDGLERFFPKEKMVKTGNPIREDILTLRKKSEEAYQHFGLSKEKKTILVVGGSLGSTTLNDCMSAGIEEIESRNVQLIWQTGENFYRNIPKEIIDRQSESTKIVPFIKSMNMAYSVADIIVSRAGAIAISELAIVGTATILVPYPFASEDHQTKNAAVLAGQKAAYLIPDDQAREKLMAKIIYLLENEEECAILGENIRKFAQPDAIHDIIHEILSL